MFPYLSIGPLSLPVPELSLIVGFWLGTLLTEHEIRMSNLDHKTIDNLIWILLISGLLGARVSYLARNFTAFQGNFKAIFSFNPALLDPSSGYLIALTSGFIFLSRKQISYWKILDGLTFLLSSMLISLSISKFASGKDYGLPTSLPWGINLWGEIRHPVQLYFLAAGIFTLIIVVYIYRRRYLAPGLTFLVFSALTSGGYLLLSRFRIPGPYLPGGYRLYQVIFWLFLAISLSLYIYFGRSKIWEKEHGSQE